MLTLCQSLWITASLTFFFCWFFLELIEKLFHLQPIIRRTSSILHLGDADGLHKKHDESSHTSSFKLYDQNRHRNTIINKTDKIFSEIQKRNIDDQTHNDTSDNIHHSYHAHNREHSHDHEVTIDIANEIDSEYHENSLLNPKDSKTTQKITPINIEQKEKKEEKEEKKKKKKKSFSLLTLKPQNYPEFPSIRSHIVWRLTHSLDSKGRFRITRNVAMDYLNMIFDLSSSINLIVLAIIRPQFYIDCFYNLRHDSIYDPLIQHQAVVIAIFYMFEISIKHGAKTDWSYACHHLFTIMACIQTICGQWFPEGLIYGATQIIMPGLVLDVVFAYRSQFSSKHPRQARILLIIGYYWYMGCVFSLIAGQIYIISVKIYFLGKQAYDWLNIIFLIIFYLGCGQQDYIVANALREYIQWDYRLASLDPKDRSMSSQLEMAQEPIMSKDEHSKDNNKIQKQNEKNVNNIENINNINNAHNDINNIINNLKKINININNKVDNNNNNNNNNNTKNGNNVNNINNINNPNNSNNNNNNNNNDNVRANINSNTNNNFDNINQNNNNSDYSNTTITVNTGNINSDNNNKNKTDVTSNDDNNKDK